jgi:hypothetical protein
LKSASLTSGFTRADFLLSFSIADAERRARFAALCDSEWGGTRITESTWELATPLSPADLEVALSAHLAPGDHAAYYYLATALADSSAHSAHTKRLFRIVITG